MLIIGFFSLELFRHFGRKSRTSSHKLESGINKSVLVAGVVGSFFHAYLSKLLGFKKTVCAVGLSSLLFLRVLEDIFQ